MLRSRKWLIPIAAVGLIIIGLFVVPSVIDINTYRGQITSQLEQRLGRSVTLGALRLSLFPSLKVEVADAAIGDDPQFAQGEFIKARSVRLRIGLWSLLTGDPEVRSIELTEPVVTLIKGKQETWNWRTLKPLQTEEPSAELAPIDMAIQDGRFTMIDRSQSPPTERTYTGVNVSLKDFSSRSASDFSVAITMPGEQAGKLELQGTVGPMGVKDFARTPIEARVTMQQVDLAGLETLLGQPSSREGRITLDAEADGRLAEGLEIKGEIKAEKLRLVENTEPADTPLETKFTLKATAQGKSDYAVNIASGELKLGTTRMDLIGQANQLPTNPMLDLQLKGDQMALDGLLESAHAFGFGPPKGTSASGKANITLRVTGPLKAIALNGGGNLWDVRVQTPQLTQPLTIKAADLKFTGDSLRIENLQGQLTQSQITGWVQVRDFAHPSVGFDLQLDQWIVSEFQQLLADGEAARSDQPTVAGRQAGWLSEALAQRKPRASGLANLRADGQLASRRVVLDNLTATDLQSQVTLREQVINLDPLSFNFYGGRYDGQVRIDMTGSEPDITLGGRFGGVDVNQFLSAASSLKNMVYGRAGGTLNLRGRGRQFDPLVKSLAGQGQLTVTEGKITSFDLEEQIALVGKLTGLPTGGAGTVFRQLSTAFRFANGKLLTDGLQMDLGQMAVSGTGGLQLGDPVTTDYDLLAQLSRELTQRVLPGGRGFAIVGNFFMQGQSLVVPLKMSGPITQPRFSLNTELLRRRMTERFRRQPERVVEDILDIFKRKDESKSKGQERKP